MSSRPSLPALLLMTALAAGCAEAGGPNPTGGSIAIVPGAVAVGTAGFTPNPLTVSGTRVVTWVNGDFAGSPATGTVHHLLSDENLFDSGSVPPEGSFSFTFPGPGTYHYRCKTHLNMYGTVTIAD